MNQNGFHRRTWRRRRRDSNACPPRPPTARQRFTAYSECWLHQIIMLPGHTKSSEHQVVIGRVVAGPIDDAALTADGCVDVLKNSADRPPRV